MPKKIIINARPYDTRIAILEDGVVAELYSERKTFQDLIGNIYAGKIARVLQGMQAALVDIGLERAAFLYVSDVHRDMFNIEQSIFGDLKEHDRVDLQDLEDFESPRHALLQFHIEDLLREGQHIMVQVAKEPRGEKGARLTTYISIPGRYLVLMPKVDHIGISRLIIDKAERERLKEIIHKLRPNNFGFIVRTNGEDASEETLRSEMNFLLKLWDGILEKNENHFIPGLIHKDLQASLRAVRDMFSRGVEQLIIDSADEYIKLTESIN